MDKKKKIIIGVVIAVVAVAAVVLSIVLAKGGGKKRKIKCMWKKSRQSAAMMRGQRTVFRCGRGTGQLEDQTGWR